MTRNREEPASPWNGEIFFTNRVRAVIRFLRLVGDMADASNRHPVKLIRLIQNSQKRGMRRGSLS